jgi:hypothetical protein
VVNRCGVWGGTHLDTPLTRTRSFRIDIVYHYIFTIIPLSPTNTPKFPKCKKWVFSTKKQILFFYKIFLAPNKIYTIFITMDKGFLTRLFAIVLSVLHPIILISTQGILGSLSQYWDTPLQPMFIAVNAITSYFFFSIQNWRPASLFLLLLTAFSHSQYPLTHNILAIIFFLLAFYALLKSIRFKFWGWIFGGFLLIMPFSLLWGEVLCILVLSGYHLHILLYKESLFKKQIIDKIYTHIFCIFPLPPYIYNKTQ